MKVRPTSTKPRAPLASITALWKRGTADRQGATAVEFSLLMPIFVAFMVGAVALFDAVRASKRVDETAAIVSDLASRLLTLDENGLASLYATSEALLLTSIDSDTVSVTITSVATRLVDGEEERQVVWSQSNHDAPRTEVDDVDLPQIPLGESVILVEVEQDYEPIFEGLPQPVFSLSKSAVRRPRFANEVIFEEN